MDELNGRLVACQLTIADLANRNLWYGFVNRDFQRIKQDIGTAGVEYQLNDNVTLSSKFRRQQSLLDYVGTFAESPKIVGSTIPGGQVSLNPQSRYQQTAVIASQNDATIKFDTGPAMHTSVVGTEISHEQITRDSYTGLSSESVGPGGVQRQRIDHRRLVLSAQSPAVQHQAVAGVRAPVIGAGQNALKMKAEWTKRLFAHLSRHKRYPQGVRQRQAEARVLFTLDRTGHVVTAQVSKTVGDAAFDGAALDMMKRSDPVPAPPPLVADEGLTFGIPVAFRAGAQTAR